MYIKRKDFLNKIAATIRIQTAFRAFQARKQFLVKRAHEA